MHRKIWRQKSSECTSLSLTKPRLSTANWNIIWWSHDSPFPSLAFASPFGMPMMGATGGFPFRRNWLELTFRNLAFINIQSLLTPQVFPSIMNSRMIQNKLFSGNMSGHAIESWNPCSVCTSTKNTFLQNIIIGGGLKSAWRFVENFDVSRAKLEWFVFEKVTTSFHTKRSLHIVPKQF